MNQKVFAIKDIKLDTYATPFFSINDATALRAFEELVNDENTQINKYSSDFTLHRIGSYNSATAELIPEQPTQIAHAPDYKHEPNIT